MRVGIRVRVAEGVGVIVRVEVEVRVNVAVLVCVGVRVGRGVRVATFSDEAWTLVARATMMNSAALVIEISLTKRLSMNPLPSPPVKCAG